MSIHNPSRKWGRFGTALAVILIVMTTAVSGVAAKSSSRTTAVKARIALARRSLQPASAPVAGRVLGGATSQTWPVVLAISGDGKSVNAALAGLVLSCSSGASLPLVDGWAKLPIGPNGSVHAAAAIPPSSGSGVSLTGGSHSFTGKLNRKRATFSGVWQLQLAFSLSNGQTDQCDSGRVSFSARL